MQAQEHSLKSQSLVQLPFQLIFHNQKLTVRHDHDFHELVVVLRGMGLHCTERTQHHLSPGDVFVIPPGEMHCYKNVENLFIANVLLDMERLLVPLDEWRQFPGFAALFEVEPTLRKNQLHPRHFSLNVEGFTQVQTILEKLKNELTNKKSGYKRAAGSLIVELLVMIFRCYNTSSEPMTFQMTQLAKILQFMQNNLHRKLTLQEIAAQGNMSIRTANRLFQSLLKTSPLQHFMELRMEDAAKKLCNNIQPISHIAYQYGFSDSNHFTTAFRRHFGMSPREYLKNYSKQVFFDTNNNTK